MSGIAYGLVGAVLSGVAKVWVYWEQDGAHGIHDSFNMDSVTDGGVGDSNHLWTKDFNSVDYVITGTCSDSSWLDPIAGQKTVGGVKTYTRLANGSGVDRDENHMAIFGDQ